MRPFYVVVVASLCAGLMLAPGAGAAKKKRAPSCNGARTTTVHKNKSVRLYETDGVKGSRLWGCLRRSGKKRFLAEATDNGLDDSQNYTGVHLAGYWVAWSFEKSDLSCATKCQTGYPGSAYSIKLYNLRSKKRRTIPVPNTPLRKVLTSRGALAWIQRSPVDGAFELLVRDSAGQRVVAHASDVSQLTLRGSTISWVQDGATRTTTLR